MIRYLSDILGYRISIHLLGGPLGGGMFQDVWAGGMLLIGLGGERDQAEFSCQAMSARDFDRG